MAALGDDDLVTIEYRGRPVTMPWGKARGLVQRGHDYETKMAALKEDKESYGAWQAYREYMLKNPQLAGVISDALQDYEQTGVLPKFIADDLIAEEGDTQPAPTRDNRLAQEVRELRGRFDQAEQQHARELFNSTLVKAIESNPVLAAVSEDTFKRTGRDLALEKLVQMAQPDPSTGVLPSPQEIEALAEAAATEFAFLRGETLGDRQDVTRDRPEDDPRRFVSERPADSPPPGPTDTGRPSFSAKDMKDGNIRKEAERFLAQSFGEG